MKFCRLLINSVWLLIFAATAYATSSYPPPANIRITNIPQLNNEEQVWICPTDSNIIIANWRDFRLGYRQVGIGRSTNGGLTWIDSLISMSMQVFPGDSWQSDPTLTVDRMGNFYISVLDFLPSGSEDSYIAFYKSTDKGVSWTGPVLHLPQLNPNVFEDKQYITVDRTGGPYDGNLYCAWARFPATNGPNRMAFVRSVNGGASFQDTVIVGPPQMSTGCGLSKISSGQFPIPVVASNGNVHVFWLGTVLDSGATCSGYDGIKHVVSTDGGQTFGGADLLLAVSGWSYAQNGTDIYSAPAADADISGGPFDGHLYVAFTNYGPEDLGRSDIDFVRSTDNGLSWSSRLQINDDVNSGLNDSYHPWVIVNEDGVVMVFFYDTRFDPPQYLLFDAMAAYSFDGGLTFTSNHRISSVSSNAANLKLNSQDDQPVEYDENGLVRPPVIASRGGRIGEYIGITAFHDKINAVWTDSRNGNSEVYTANWHLPILEPRLIAPVNGIYTNSNPTFRWATAWKHNEDRYRLEVSDNPNFTSGVSIHQPDTNFFTPIIDLQEGTHYWRVKAFKTTNQDSSAYSETRVLIVDNTPPDQTQLLSPVNGAITQDPMPAFSWTDVSKSGAPVVYDLYISTDSTFPVGPLTKLYSDIATADYTPTDPLAVDVFSYWRVVARDLVGNSSTSVTNSVKHILFICGDVNNDLAGPNILDLTYLVSYIFRSGPFPPIPAAADVDGSGGNPNIIDLTKIVDRIFRGGPLPTCGA